LDGETYHNTENGRKANRGLLGEGLGFSSVPLGREHALHAARAHKFFTRVRSAEISRGFGLVSVV